jgi:hypothetical protein
MPPFDKLRGAMLGPDCALVRRTPDGYRCLGRDEAAALQALLFADGDPDWLFRQCRCIAKALAENNLALAQIYALYIPIEDLDDRHLRRLAIAAPLLKANFNPDEPPRSRRHDAGGQGAGICHFHGRPGRLEKVVHKAK